MHVCHVSQSIGGCRSLTTLDVSCNQIELFPPEVLVDILHLYTVAQQLSFIDVTIHQCCFS